MVGRLLAAVLLSGSVALSALAVGPLPGQIKNLVTFGDSYTDVDAHADGGIMWPVFAAEDGNFNLFPFAKAGATCSNNLTARPFPSVFESQLPLYFTEKGNGSLRLNPEDTMYTLWIGTNDVGVGALLTGSQAPGVTVVDTVACAVNWIKVLYASGARNFIFQNMIPLETTPLYAADSWPNRYWTAQRNTTEWSVFMKELTTSGNEIAKLMLQALAPTLHGAHLGLFDSHSLFADMFARPQLYLNGTAPLNVTGAVHACIFQLNESTSDPGVCTDATGTDQDSFLWFDELHPSVQAERVVAKAISDVIHRKTEKWTTWFS
ncbi:GDSL lipase/acylhydrolase [Lentinus tigrinus ALCF2SS1-7]|uniref:GDSL lipase/acylhydrolase n=1 Tax=Lentinus tigrinus ALCF2SS1-6 TaxID=1328759 RepID=A0A5C2S6U4_9APHY|nr:GDSL lipase/acylhydrolase [Lentinus tigrinus ALCF2SS1-6]RPD69813.1 GDSL lipase/acylhydrolase [Lentinus tigrinus ALCF2SS1-7]